MTHPNFDPNLFVSGISPKLYHQLISSNVHPLYDRAVQGQFAAGSTIKPFIALISLDKNFISLKDKIFDPGWFKLPNAAHIYHDYKEKGHGWVDITQAIIVSCDAFFYNLAAKLGIANLSAILKQFGFGQATGVDLPEETSGLLPSPHWKIKTQGHPWYTGDTIEEGIGQGFLLVTPLQLAYAVSTIANRGLQVKPHLLLKMSSPQNADQFLSIPPTITGKIRLQNPKYWQIIISAMQGVVENPFGTAIFFGKHNFSVAAKTGTAQVYGRQRDEEHTRLNIPKQLRNNHLFIAFAPVNEPKIAIAVVIEHNAYADKIAGEIMRYYFSRNDELK